MGAPIPVPYGNGSEPEAEPDRVPIREYFGIIRRHIWLVLGVVAFCTGIALYKAMTDPPVFYAEAVIRLKDSSKAVAGGLAGPAVASAGYGNPILSQLEVLRSRSVIGQVVDSLGLRLQAVGGEDFAKLSLADVRVAPDATVDTIDLSFSSAGVSVRAEGRTQEVPYGSIVSLPGVQFLVSSRPEVESASLVLIPREFAAAQLLQSLQTRQRENTDIIDVGYFANDPLRAQHVANAVVESFQGYNATVEQQQARRRRLFVEGQLQYADSVLGQAQAALTAFRQQQQLFSTREKFASEQVGVAGIEMELDQLRAERSTYQTLLNTLRPSRADGATEGFRTLVGAPGMAANPAVAQLYGQLVQYQTVRDSLTVGAGASPATGPEVRRIDELIATTQRRLASAAASTLSALDARIQAMEELRKRNAGSATQLARVEAEEAALLSRVEYMANTATELRDEYQRAKIAEAVEGGQVQIVDSALPGGPVQSGRIRTVLFGLALGLMLGCGGAIVRENMNTSIRRKDEVEKVLHVPELAIIPAIGGSNGNGRLALPLFFGSKNGNGNGNGKSPLGHGGTELVSSLQSQSPSAEAYRTLRTNLIFSQSVRALRRIVVTSSAPAEGKSTTASNLAVTFAQQGMRVLLVDCDLRKARLHKVFQVPREPGFTHFALGLKQLNEVVHSTSVDGLSFLSSGTLPPNPAELLGGAAMQQALDTLSEHYDLVVLDTPPLLAASDAAILGRQVDGVVLVVKAGATEREAARQSVQRLSAVGARVLGAVLNDPDSKVGKYGGYYHYEYYGESTS